MIPVKTILEKQWYEFCKYVKEYALKDSYTNDEEYNYGRYEIINNQRIDFLNPVIEYYCMCNNLSLKDIPGGINSILS